MKTQFTESERMLKADFRVIVFNDDLERDWEFAGKEKVERIETVWFYDASIWVHCCEIMPSYELNLVEYRAIIKPEFENDQEFKDYVDSVVAEATWGNDNTQYRHVREVDRYVANAVTNGQRVQVALGDRRNEEETYDELAEAVMEFVHCNSQI